MREKPGTMVTGDDLQFVAFRLASQEFAFNIFQVERILRYEAAAPCPRPRSFSRVWCPTRERA